MPYLTPTLAILVALLAYACVRLMLAREAAARAHREYVNMLRIDCDEAHVRIYQLHRVVAASGELLDHVGIALEGRLPQDTESHDLKRLGAILRASWSHNNFFDPEEIQQKAGALGDRYGIEPGYRVAEHGAKTHGYDEARLIRIGEAIIVEHAIRQLSGAAAYEVGPGSSTIV